jgi:amyloid beta A4 precursor protein-binding family B protein 1-interacting protein
MKEANVTKLFVKVFSKDGGAKSLLVDENMKCGYVTKLLADKHHISVSPRWGLVEHLPELYMGELAVRDDYAINYSARIIQ